MKANSDQLDSALFTGAKRILYGALLAGAVALFGQFMIGRIYNDTEARSLLQAMTPFSRYVASSAAGASSTILALMLTMLGLTQQLNVKLGKIFYKRIKSISILSTISLILAMLLLLLMSIPLEDTYKAPQELFNILYYVVLIATSATAGLLVGIVLSLYEAIKRLIYIISGLDGGGDK